MLATNLSTSGKETCIVLPTMFIVRAARLIVNGTFAKWPYVFLEEPHHIRSIVAYKARCVLKFNSVPCQCFCYDAADHR